jgi:hypothetical protein
LPAIAYLLILTYLTIFLEKLIHHEPIPEKGHFAFYF